VAGAVWLTVPRPEQARAAEAVQAIGGAR